MTNIPENLKYTKDHEWALVENNVVTVGITDFAQTQLGDIVFVELPEVGDSLDRGSSFGVVESIKSVSDLYAPIDGEIIEVNNDLVDSPENCNTAPYESWMVKIKINDDANFEDLIDPDSYKEICEE